jgi:hypothetical protein
MVHLPYINVLLGKLEQEGDTELKALARHLHFGFWSAPQEAAVTQEALAVAGDRLSDLVCTAAAVGDDQTILDVGCGLGGTIARITRHRCGVATIKPCTGTRPRSGNATYTSSWRLTSNRVPYAHEK